LPLKLKSSKIKTLKKNSKVQKSKLVRKMNIISRKTQKLKTAKSENNEHYY